MSSVTTERQSERQIVDLRSYLDPRVRRRDVQRRLRRLRSAARRARQDERRYRGGLAAEQASLKKIRDARLEEVRASRRRIVLSRRGRRIDLAGLMRQRNPDGTPVWCLVDPRKKWDASLTGKHDTDGMVYWCGWTRVYEREESVGRAFVPIGMPALPQRVRDLVTDPAVTRRARRLGVLYQPQEWREVNPDPALVVEWHDLPDEYYALAVWGPDMPRIMEYVD